MRSLILYSRAGCSPCRTVKHLLDANGIKYEVRDVEENPAYYDEAIKYALSVPIVVEGDEFVIGPNMARIKELAGI